jgi:hypothetical protein
VKFKFHSPSYKSQLVYSANLDMGEAVATAFEASTSELKIIHDAATISRNHIQRSHYQATEQNVK